MKHIISFLALLCLYGSSWCQTLQPLKVGEKVPDIVFNTVLNYTSNNATLKQLKKQITLIDFWGTTCGACIKKIPEWDALQKKYPTQLSVLLVNTTDKDTKEKVSKVMNRIYINTGGQVTLPVILGDTLMKTMFPHTYVPYYALLDEQLRVLAVADDDGISPEKVAAFIQNRYSSSNAGVVMGFPQKEFLSTNGTVGDGAEILFRTTISGYNPMAKSAKLVSKDSTGKLTKLLFTNQTLLEMIQTAYSYHNLPAYINYPLNEKERLDSKGRSKEWRNSNSYTYELITPPLTSASAYVQMQEDIKKVFGYTAEVRSSDMPYYEMSIDAAVLQKHNALQSKALGENNAFLIGELIAVLGNHLALPLENGAAYSGTVYIQLANSDFANLRRLKKILAAAGISLTEKKKNVPTLFIIHSTNQQL